MKRKRNEQKSYIGDNFLITRSYKIRYTYDCIQKKFQGCKTKSIFLEFNLFSERFCLLVKFTLKYAWLS